MFDKSKVKSMQALLAGLGILLAVVVIYYLRSPITEVDTSIALKHKDVGIVDIRAACVR